MLFFKKLSSGSLKNRINHNSKIEAKRIMKKNYEQPACLVLEVESQGVFCTSGTATYSSSEIEEWGDVKKIEW